MNEALISSQGSFLLNSQGSDLFPAEVKQCLDDPEFQDVINTVQNQDPFMDSQNGDLGYTVSITTENGGIVEMITNSVSVPQAPMPTPTCTMLCTEEYPGPYEFEVQVNGENSGKNWMFSYDLNKLFITMNAVIHLSFKCNTFPPGLYVRAIPVYCQSEHFQQPVVRCMHHGSPGFKLNEGVYDHIRDHVIMIENPHSQYDYNETSHRRSVRLQLDSPQPGSDWVTIAFKFMCKNSCISGMNRRPIEVIFTLEDIDSVVYGRQKMKVRICSCPKRDKMKEEYDLKAREPKNIPQGKHLMDPKEGGGSRPPKQRKTDEICQISVLKRDYVTCLHFHHYTLKKRLQFGKREPTEIESQLLREYEEELLKHEPQATWE